MHEEKNIVYDDLNRMVDYVANPNKAMAGVLRGDPGGLADYGPKEYCAKKECDPARAIYTLLIRAHVSECTGAGARRC